MPWFTWLVLLVLHLGIWVSETDSCSCRRMHPQQMYCRDDFAILVRVRREFVTNDRRIYVIAIRKRYKVNEKAQEALRTRHLITSSEDSMCGVQLDVGKVYALTGSIEGLKAHINLCQMAIPWKNLTKRQRKGLKVSYQNGCNCKIKQCTIGKCKKIRTVCNWVQGPTSSCFANEGVCLKTPSNQCMWMRNKDLARCKRSTYLPFLGDQDRRSGQ